jgi:hypothetical protein
MDAPSRKMQVLSDLATGLARTDQSFFARIGFDVGKDFLFVVHKKVSGFMQFFFSIFALL